MYRDELVPVDSSYESGNGIVDYKLQNIGGRDNFSSRTLRIVSTKSGNDSRQLYAIPIEIENVCGIYWLLNTSKKIRNTEKVVENNKEVEVRPVGRLKYNGKLVYSIHYA